MLPGAQSGLLFLVLFGVFLAVGLGWYFKVDHKRGDPISGQLFGRTLFGAGLFYFFFCLIVVVAYGASKGADLYDPEGKLMPQAMSGDFTLGLFVALKDIGAPLGVALGFLSLAWGRFFDATIMSKDHEKTNDSISAISEKIDELRKIMDMQKQNG